MEREDKGNPKKCPSPSTAQENVKPVQKENRSTLFQAEAPEAPLSPPLTWEETRSCTEPSKVQRRDQPRNPFAAAQISRHLIHPGIKQSSPKSHRRTMIGRQTWHPSSYHQNTRQTQLEQRNSLTDAWDHDQDPPARTKSNKRAILANLSGRKARQRRNMLNGNHALQYPGFHTSESSSTLQNGTSMSQGHFTRPAGPNKSSSMTQKMKLQCESRKGSVPRSAAGMNVVRRTGSIP